VAEQDGRILWFRRPVEHGSAGLWLPWLWAVGVARAADGQRLGRAHAHEELHLRLDARGSRRDGRAQRRAQGMRACLLAWLRDAQEQFLAGGT